MITGLDHVAVAVADLNESIRKWCDDLGLPLDGTEDVVQQKTTTAFLATSAVPGSMPGTAVPGSMPGTAVPGSMPGTGVHVELVHPLNGEGAIADSLAKRGPGLHHLCFRTDDLDADVARLKDRGWKFTTEAPTAGAHGTRVMFAHPRSTGGVLIELVEHPVGAGR